MRIIAGKHKGRRIELPKELGPGVRPTSDFARQAIFNILAHGRHGLNGQGFEGLQVLDVFCGTGAFGLESLSRGAARVMFIDSAREAIATARHNIERIGELAQADFLQANATKLGRAPRAYQLVFLDPPYFSGLLLPTLAALAEGGWLSPNAILIAEHDEKEALELPAPFERLDERRYGRAVVEVIKAVSS
jgi:16S rRNA (guanine966-N2)-methyltransferase